MVVEGIVAVPTLFRAALRPPPQRKAATGVIPVLPAPAGATARPPADLDSSGIIAQQVNRVNRDYLPAN
jgi:hypothetical protein